MFIVRNFETKKVATWLAGGSSDHMQDRADRILDQIEAAGKHVAELEFDYISGPEYRILRSRTLCADSMYKPRHCAPEPAEPAAV